MTTVTKAVDLVDGRYYWVCSTRKGHHWDHIIEPKLYRAHLRNGTVLALVPDGSYTSCIWPEYFDGFMSATEVIKPKVIDDLSSMVAQLLGNYLVKNEILHDDVRYCIHCNSTTVGTSESLTGEGESHVDGCPVPLARLLVANK